MKKKISIGLIALAFILLGLGLYFGLIKKNSNVINGTNKNAELMQTYVVNFELNEAESISSNIASCLPENGTCIIKTPTITPKEGYKVIGWSTKVDDTSKEYDQNFDIEISGNIVLYAITKYVVNDEELNIGTICNTNKINSSVKVVNVAYSQIGYKEKKDESKIDSCTDNAGDNNINKYGNSGNAWQYAFINWCFSSSGIDLKIENLDNQDEFISNAKANNTWYTSKSMLHDGDLVVTNNSIGIAVFENNTWKMVEGNKSNSVQIVEIQDTLGYISMNKIAY